MIKLKTLYTLEKSEKDSQLETQNQNLALPWIATVNE
ncbi:hypothetical protein GWI33_010868, partial [Rhynchophorus ferrugineus]